MNPNNLVKPSAFYTWKDIEYWILSNSEYWPNEWQEVEVYHDEIVIYLNIDDHKNSDNFMERLFGSHYKPKKNTVILDITEDELQIIYKDLMDYFFGEKKPLPLFKNSYLQQSEWTAGELPDIDSLQVPVVAFHSYKGGVGRTLSLLALLREISSKENARNSEYKVLVIDSDIEAPGLTWLTDDRNIRPISYLDVLSLIHNTEDINNNSELFVKIANIIQQTSFSIETDEKICEHYFLPAYRLEYQLMDLYAHPEKIVSIIGKEFAITDCISRIGKELGADAILIDLRAGISEISAPILFDPRVKKIYVTSTSEQSIKGTKMVLRQVYKNFDLEKIATPTIQLTMIPQDFDTEKKDELIRSLLDIFEKPQDKSEKDFDRLLSDMVLQTPFSDRLIHLDGLQHISYQLSGTEAVKTAKYLSERLFPDNVEIRTHFFENRIKIVEDINQFTKNEIVAESSGLSGLLATKSLGNLVRSFKSKTPLAVILGAKGSGKTFVYRQLLKFKTWEMFSESVVAGYTKAENNTIVIPVIASENRAKFVQILKDCYLNANKELPFLEISLDALAKNSNNILECKSRSFEQREWHDFWKTMIEATLTNKGLSLKEIDGELYKQNKRILLIFDGLEDMFNETISDSNSKNAIRALCQDFMNFLNEEVEHQSIGALIFLRKDMADNSIGTNYEQFVSQYSDYELAWTQTEALRLALWVVSEVEPLFKPTVSSVERASREIIETQLCNLWGVKLGRPASNEAFSSRWILAALSDFNGQLQARDIIRFLYNATLSCGLSASYSDRVIMPTEIKEAILPCSAAKVEEIKQEIPNMEPIFEVLSCVDNDKKLLPLDPDLLGLTVDQRKILTQQGYLKFYGEKYYLPEIIRHALGYRYQKGARPKVLSLLLN